MTVETGRHAEGQAQTLAESDVRDRTSPSDPCTPGIGHPTGTSEWVIAGRGKVFTELEGDGGSAA